MDVFNALFVMSLGSYICDEDKFDIIKKLPVEIAIMILRKLDGAALSRACQVNKYWNNLCKTDKILKHKIRGHLKDMRIRKQRMIFGDLGRFDYVPKIEHGAFKSRNVQQPVTNQKTVVQIIPSSSRSSHVPLVVIQPKGELLQGNGSTNDLLSGQRKHDDVKPVRGIPKSKKRRLLRL